MDRPSRRFKWMPKPDIEPEKLEAAPVKHEMTWEEYYAALADLAKRVATLPENSLQKQGLPKPMQQPFEYQTPVSYPTYGNVSITYPQTFTTTVPNGQVGSSFIYNFQPSATITGLNSVVGQYYTIGETK